MSHSKRNKFSYDIYLDGIIFWLQKSGGISSYWFALNQFLFNEGIPFYQTYQKSNCSNVFNEWICEHLPSCVEYFPLNISRYMPAKIVKPKGRMGVFHSSYYRTCREKGLANVVTVYDFMYERYRTGLPKIVHSKQKFHSIRKADIVICISNNTKNDLMKYIPDFDVSQVRVIHLGVSDDFHPLETKNQFSPIDIKQPYVVFVGERRGYKRFDLALRAIQNIPRLHLLIIGREIDSNEYESLNKAIPERWHCLGYVSVKKLNEYYNSAFALIYPSDYEGFGMPVLEAMRAGCPVVCSATSSLPEIAGNSAICVPEQNVDSYSLALKSLFNIKLRNRLIYYGLEHLKRFTWKKCFEKTFAAYNDAIENKYK